MGVVMLLFHSLVLYLVALKGRKAIWWAMFIGTLAVCARLLTEGAHHKIWDGMTLVMGLGSCLWILSWILLVCSNHREFIAADEDGERSVGGRGAPQMRKPLQKSGGSEVNPVSGSMAYSQEPPTPTEGE